LIRFAYCGFHGCPSVCGLDIQPLANDRTVVICTELPDNPGTSVTNFAEDLATLVCRRFRIASDKLVWIEHYPPSASHGPKADWDRVEFSWDGDCFQQPRWRPMRSEDWKQLGLCAPEA
jgi:hypothetical protein